MRPLNVCLIDLVGKGPNSTLWARIMHANLASIMPQVIATWCEQEGHQVTLICYTGQEDLGKEIPNSVNLLFISAFTQSALLAYAISNYARRKGIVTVLGGPHARCYPDDAMQYFDFVLGFTNRSTIVEVLNNCTPQRPLGRYLSAGKQPADLCGVQERWKFIEPTLKKAPFLKIVPMLGSVGCPYTCPFCIDSSVPYQPLDFQLIKEDLRFLLQKFRKPWIAWHDPNFGIRFEENMEAIEDAAPPKSFRFIAESSLSVITEKRVKVLERSGFMALLPGIESWYDLGNKSRTSHITGGEKVKQVSEHIKMIFRHVPYVQTNFVLGLDSDSGAEPFELTKQFIDRTPHAFPGYSLLTAFGEAAPINLEYQKAGRVLPFPFHFLNNHLAMNVRPQHYDWVEFYDRVIDLTTYSFSLNALYRRFRGAATFTSRWMNLMRAVSSEGYGRLRFFRQIRANLVKDKGFRQYFDGESKLLPAFYHNLIKKDLGVWWEWLPEGAVTHNENAYFHKTVSGGTT